MDFLGVGDRAALELVGVEKGELTFRFRFRFSGRFPRLLSLGTRWFLFHSRCQIKCLLRKILLRHTLGILLRQLNLRQQRRGREFRREWQTRRRVALFALERRSQDNLFVLFVERLAIDLRRRR